MFGAYREYPFRVPLRTRFINLFRCCFTWSLPERLLIRRLLQNPSGLWKRLIPPLYLYPPGSLRFATRNGIAWKLDISRVMEHSLYFNRVRDKAWANLFGLLKEDFNIIDAGANIGYLTLRFARHCPAGMVYSFEPDPDSFEDLSANVAQNSFSNIRLFRKALGAAASTATMYKLYRMNPGTNRILPGAPPEAIRSETVEVIPLDSLDARQEFRRIDLIKIDVEGFEPFVLQGAEGLIRKWKPILFIELVEENLALQAWTAARLVAYVQALGYTVLDAQTMQPYEQQEEAHTDILCFAG